MGLITLESQAHLMVGFLVLDSLIYCVMVKLMKYTPNEGRILIVKLRKPNYIKVSSGIVVPGEGIMNRELERGEVVHGTDKIKKGQIIWYDKYSSTMLYDETLGSFYCLAEEDVMVFEEGKASDKERDIKIDKGEALEHPQTARDTKKVSIPTAKN